MNRKTHEYYVSHALDCTDRYETADMTPVHRLLEKYVHSGDRILEIGGGSGRDAAFLTRLGCQVTFTDGTPGMFQEAIRRHPELAPNARVAIFPLPDDDPLLNQRFDLILCMAVIMHLDDESLEKNISQMAHLTRIHGRVLVSHSTGRSGLIDYRDPEQRLFCERTPERVREMFHGFGYDEECCDQNRDGLNRTNVIWTTHIMQYRTSGR